MGVDWGQSKPLGGYFLALIENESRAFHWSLIPFILIWSVFGFLLLVRILGFYAAVELY